MRRMLFVIVLLGTVAAWSEPTVRFRADRNNVQVGVPFQLVLEMTGGRIGSPTLPEVPGLEIDASPINRMVNRQFEFGTGGMKTVNRIMLAYMARASKPGKLTIPGVSVEIEGKTVTSQAIIITVSDSGAPNAAPPSPVPVPSAVPVGSRPPPSSPTDTPAAHPTKEPTWDDAAYIETSVDKAEVYEGESLILTLSLGALGIRGLKVHPLQGQNRALPTTEGFYALPLEQERQTTTQRNGFDYTVQQRRIALCPTVSGDLKIGGWHWEGVGINGFQERGISLDSEPIAVKVKPLPDRPAGFSGAVGAFSVEGQMERMSAVQGTPVRLIVKVTGQGNPDAIGEPVFPKIENAYVGDSEKDVKTQETETGYTVTKTFTYSITPLNAGELTVPSLEFCYFDPAESAFKTVKTSVFQVSVSASNERASRMVVADSLPTQSGQVHVLGEDIHPLITEAGNLAPSRPWPYAAPVVVGVPVVAYGLLALVMGRKRRFASDRVFARAHGALGKSRRRLGLIEKSSEPTEDAYRALTGYIADVLDVPEGGIASSDVPRLFGERGFAEESAKDVSDFLKSCERVRYGSERLGKSPKALAEEAGALVKRLESAGRERKR